MANKSATHCCCAERAGLSNDSSKPIQTRRLTSIRYSRPPHQWLKPNLAKAFKPEKHSKTRALCPINILGSLVLAQRGTFAKLNRQWIHLDSHLITLNLLQPVLLRRPTRVSTIKLAVNLSRLTLPQRAIMKFLLYTSTRPCNAEVDKLLTVLLRLLKR